MGSHLDRTTGLAVDTLQHRIISAGDDRTIRVWDLSTGRLEKTLRVPSAERKEGEIYSLAFAPKSQTIAVGGWSGFRWDGAASVYVYDLQSGEMRRPLRGFKERITALAFSDDGQRLAVVLNNGTLFLFKVPEGKDKDYQYIAHSEACKAISYRIDFAPDGRLVANCFDGFVRVYNENLDLIVQAAPEGGSEPSGVDFSPDGRQIAVGFHDTNIVTVLDSETLEEHFRPDTAQIAEDQQVPQVAWSSTGDTLYAAGDLHDDSGYQIVSWDKQGRGKAQFSPASSKRLFRMLAMPAGGVAFTSLEHSVGVLKETGEIGFYNKPPIIDHQFHQADFRISAAGDAVMFLVEKGANKKYAYFSLWDRQLSIRDTLDGNMLSPIITHKDYPIRDWSDSEAPMYGDKPIEIYPYQRSHSLAIDPNDDYFVLGIDAELRRFNNKGEVQWSVYPPSTAFALNITADGGMIIGAFEDGSIRWFRSDDGSEVMALFVHASLEDWVVWIPDGFFLSSPNGDRYIGWHLNNGKDKKPEYYTAFQFERLLYRPDLVERYFTDRGDWKGQQAEIKHEFSVSDIRQAAPPNIEFPRLASRGIGKNTSSYALNLKVKKRELPVKEYSVYVNGIPALRYAERQLNAAEKNGFTRAHNIPLTSGLNEVRVEVLTEKSMGLKTVYIEGATGEVVTAKDQESNLYVLGIGVDTLAKSPYRSLSYAVADAEAFVENIGNKDLPEFDNVYLKLLSDNSEILPTRKNITEQMSFFRPSGPNDTVILYLAAHGMSNQAGDYFLLPRDTEEGDIDFLLQNPDKAFEPESMVKWDMFFNALRDASGRRLLIVDTCQARRIKGNFDAGSLIKRSSAASFALMAASKGAEVSIESPKLGHGIFTYAMLNGLDDQQADVNSNGAIELSELFAYVTDYVEEFTESMEQVQTPQLYAPEFLLDMPLNQLQ